ncbi:hypothetical protein MWU54_06735 [Marivita sp. S6314]|uniref:hypothetical protein n=1 Tax=Marivita sp. S6314 TaxID=2926406 RepID=UPI001FF2634A|nr:hypothetical protein [Marivita sp. S6314]MCK0149712.1 hypothetical protein [Marivita sp. S6314]
MRWVSQHAPVIEAVAALVTALVAVAALVGVVIQLQAADQLSREQSARDAYRNHLALAATQPGFAQPQNACALMSGPNAKSYTAFVDHLLYSAEQMLAVEEGWDTTFLNALDPHAVYLCSEQSPDGADPNLAALLSRFWAERCDATPTCD